MRKTMLFIFSMLSVLFFTVGCKKDTTQPEKSIETVLRETGAMKIDNYVPANGEKIFTVQSGTDLQNQFSHALVFKNQNIDLQPMQMKNEDNTVLRGGGPGDTETDPRRYNRTFTGTYNNMNVSLTIYYDAYPGGVGGVSNVSITTSMIVSPGIGSYTQNAQYSVAISNNGNIITFEVTGNYIAGISSFGAVIGATYSYDFTGFFDTSSGGRGSVAVKQIAVITGAKR